jgi:hypothetical protein
VKLPAAVQRFVDTKFPQDGFGRTLVILAIVVGVPLYILNIVVTVLWWLEVIG